MIQQKKLIYESHIKRKLHIYHQIINMRTKKYRDLIAFFPFFFLCIICSPIIYYLTIGLGYGMTYGVVRNNYNMTTGCEINNDNCDNRNKIICYYDESVSFFFGCWTIGLICEVILLFIGGFISTILYLFFRANSTQTELDNQPENMVELDDSV